MVKKYKYDPGYIIITCRNCGYIFLKQSYGVNDGKRTKYSGPPSLRKIGEKYGWRCPRCGSSLGKQIELKVYQLNHINIESLGDEQ